MARIKTCKDMMNLALELVDGVLDGSVDPKRASAASRMMNTALSAAIAEARYQKQMEGVGFFGSGLEGRQNKNLGPKFEWDDSKADSFGSYIGTKLRLQAWKIKGVNYGWKVEMEHSPPIPVGDGEGQTTMDSARRAAEQCAVLFMQSNPQLESGDAGEDDHVMFKGRGY